MNRRFLLVSLLAPLLVPLLVQAQPAPPREAAQFDFLIGQWELEVTPKVSSLAAMIHGKPRLQGVWKAWRAANGFGIEDELRIFDGSGNPVTLVQAQRVFDAKSRLWQISGLDVYRKRSSSSTGERQANGEIAIKGTSTSAEGKPLLTRSRFFEIGPERFRMQQDRSTDNGASWEEAVLTISAKRVAAATAAK